MGILSLNGLTISFQELKFDLIEAEINWKWLVCYTFIILYHTTLNTFCGITKREKYFGFAFCTYRITGGRWVNE